MRPRFARQRRSASSGDKTTEPFRFPVPVSLPGPAGPPAYAHQRAPKPVRMRRPTNPAAAGTPATTRIRQTNLATEQTWLQINSSHLSRATRDLRHLHAGRQGRSRHPRKVAILSGNGPPDKRKIALGASFPQNCTKMRRGLGPYQPPIYSRKAALSASAISIRAFTRSPIDTTPSRRPSSTTGK